MYAIHLYFIIEYVGRAEAWWLRHYAANRQVACSIPNGVIVIFQWHYPSCRTMALGSTHPLTEMSTQKWVPGVFPGGKGCRCVRLTTLPPSCAVVMKSGNLNLLEPSGLLQVCFTFAFNWLRIFYLLNLDYDMGSENREEVNTKI